VIIRQHAARLRRLERGDILDSDQRQGLSLPRCGLSQTIAASKVRGFIGFSFARQNADCGRRSIERPPQHDRGATDPRCRIG